MKKLNCFVVDDEPIARKIIKEYINDIEFLNYCGEADNAIKADNALKGLDIDLLFLDIEMPKITGLDYLKSKATVPMVILTTAYPQYALESYELDVLDYLVKPIAFDRFLKAVNKGYERCNDRQLIQRDEEYYFYIKVNSKIEKILFTDILYIEGMTNYVVIHTPHKKYITHITFKGIEEKLNSTKFVRIHKSYIVSIDAVKTIDNDTVYLNDIELPISRFYKAGLQTIIEKRLFKR